MNNDIKIFGGIILATIALIIGAVFFLGRGDNSTSSGQTQANPTTIPKNLLVGDDSWAVGSPSAKVVIVEFGDFECPTCKIYEPIVAEVREKYGDKVYFVYRHFPIVGKHQYALPSATAAEAAGNQGKFWEYHDELYKISPDLTKENLTAIAKKLNLDMDKFAKERDTDMERQKVLDDLAAGNQVGVNGTPTFYINGRQYPLSELSNFAAFKAKIDPLLN